MNRRELLVLLGAAAAVPITGLAGCAPGGTTVRVLVAARATGGETIAVLRARAFNTVSFEGKSNTAAKVGWLVWPTIDADVVVLNMDHAVTGGEMATTEGDVQQDQVYEATERPEDWQLQNGDTIAFFALDCTTVAVAEGGETLTELIGANHPSQIVVLRNGHVVEGLDFDTGLAEPGDELVVFGEKIAA